MTCECLNCMERERERQTEAVESRRSAAIARDFAEESGCERGCDEDGGAPVREKRRSDFSSRARV